MTQTIGTIEHLEQLTRQVFGEDNTYTGFSFMQKERIAANNSARVDEREEDRQGHIHAASALLDYAKEQALTRKTVEFATKLVTESHEWDERIETSLNCPCLSDIKSELDESQRVALIYHTRMSEKNAHYSDVYDCFDDDDFATLVRAVVCSSPRQLDEVAARIRIKLSISQDTELEEIIDNYIAINF